MGHRPDRPTTQSFDSLHTVLCPTQVVKGAGESLITALQASNVLRSWFLDGGRRQPAAWEDDREVRLTGSSTEDTIECTWGFYWQAIVWCTYRGTCSFGPSGGGRRASSAPFPRQEWFDHVESPLPLQGSDLLCPGLKCRCCRGWRTTGPSRPRSRSRHGSGWRAR
jgi:hypothetical protein